MNAIQKIIFITSVLFASIAHASSLSTTEEQIKNFVSNNKIEQLLLLEKIVNINSGTTNITGVKKIGEILKPQFEQLGFKTTWVELPENMHRAPTLIAERKGSNGKKLLLIGHLDTVFPKESSFQKFKREGNIANGPGVLDDKGGDVVMLYALKALHKIHTLDNTTITVVLTGDEEDSGKPTSISRKPLFDAANNSDIALDFESAVTANTGSIARRGIANWTLEAEGNENHSSQIFQKPGYGAVFEITRILNTMRTNLSSEKYLSFNPGIIMGGTTINENSVFGKLNVIAKTALAKGDLRFLTAEQKQKAENQFKQIVEQHLPGTNASITFQDGIPSMPPTDANLKLLEKYSEVSADLGYGTITPLDAGSRGAGDISHIAGVVSANLAGLGPLGANEHSEKEILNVGSLTMQTQRAALLIYRLTRGT